MLLRLATEQSTGDAWRLGSRVGMGGASETKHRVDGGCFLMKPVQAVTL